MTSPNDSHLTRDDASQERGVWFAAYCIGAAFATYFCMHAFRKPFSAAEYEGIVLWGIGYKVILVAAHVSGYMLSKFIGIKVISEMPPARRAVAILVMIGLAELALLGFALIPAPWNWPLLFLNGLPLGMIFGLVLSFLEGRQLTEALSAGLCASFILASGFVKSVGRALIQDFGVAEFWMPFATGALFILPMLLAVWALSRIPPPDDSDVLERSQRLPMTGADRWNLFRRHALGLTGLVFVFVILTIVRSFRDDFGVEIWAELDPQHDSTIYARVEMLVMFAVVAVNGAAVLIRNNRTAFLSTLLLILGGFGLALVSVAGYQSNALGPFTFMVLIGIGFYVPYVAFHTTVFERMLALFRDKGNIGFLMYLADSVGYLGYIGVMLAKNWLSEREGFLSLFLTTTTVLCLVAIVIVGGLLLYYGRITSPKRAVVVETT